MIKEGLVLARMLHKSQGMSMAIDAGAIGARPDDFTAWLDRAEKRRDGACMYLGIDCYYRKLSTG